MDTAFILVAAVLSLVLVGSGAGKLAKATQVVTNLDKAGVPHGWYPWLAAAEVAGAIGLLVGIGYRPLGVAAAVGVVLYFVGAVGAHVRQGDVKGSAGPAPLLALAVAALVLGVLTT